LNRETTIASIKSKLGELKSSFYIQGGHVSPLYLKEKEFTEVKEVFLVLFSEDAESAYWFWNEVPIRFHYTYEFYANFDWILELLGKLIDQSSGKYEATLLTDQVIGALTFEWNAGQLKMTGEWKMRRNQSIFAEILNKKDFVNISTKDFLKEWFVILMQIKKSFDKAGVVINTAPEKAKIKEISRILARTEGAGKLYTR